MKKKLSWAILFSTVFMFFLLMRIEWSHFSRIAGRLDIRYLTASCMLYILGNLIRVFRFNKLDHTNKKLIHWWNINAFYNVITSTLPGGGGEAAAAYVIKQFSKFNLLTALRILLLSRLMDLFALSALFFVSASWISNVTPYREAAIWFSGSLFFVSLVALLPSSEQFVLRLLQKLPSQRKLVQRIYEKFSEVSKIAEEQRNNNSLGITLFQSVLMMTGGIISIDMALRAFGVDFTLAQVFYCYGIYAIFQIVPVQGVAGIGTQAAWWALALNAAGYNDPDAIAMGFILYGTFYIFVIFLGLCSLLWWFKDRKKQ